MWSIFAKSVSRASLSIRSIFQNTFEHFWELSLPSVAISWHSVRLGILIILTFCFLDHCLFPWIVLNSSSVSACCTMPIPDMEERVVFEVQACPLTASVTLRVSLECLRECWSSGHTSHNRTKEIMSMFGASPSVISNFVSHFSFWEGMRYLKKKINKSSSEWKLVSVPKTLIMNV